MYKYIIIIFISLFYFSVNAQPGKRTKWRTGIERCLDALGNPIENCFGVSNSSGEFIPMEIDDVLAELNITNASAVDSIWTSNDTMYVTYFNAPTLGYYAPGLNGIFGSANNNKPILAATAILNTNKSWRITNNVSGANVFSFQVLEANKQVWITTSTTQPTQLKLIGTNDAHTEYMATSRTWRAGNRAGAYHIKDIGTNITPFAIQTTPTVDNCLLLKTNGDVSLGAYTSARAFDLNPINFAGFDNNGVIQKYELQDLIDTIGVSIESNKFAETFGGNPMGEYSFVHNLGTRDVFVQIYELASGSDLTHTVDVARVNINTINVVGALTDPDAYRIIIHR